MLEVFRSIRPVDAKGILRQLGHRNTAMLFQHYSKWIDGADGGREEAKLEAIYG